MDVRWCGAEHGVVRRRLEKLLVGWCCSRVPFQESNSHQSLLLERCFSSPQIKRKALGKHSSLLLNITIRVYGAV